MTRRTRRIANLARLFYLQAHKITEGWPEDPESGPSPASPESGVGRARPRDVSYAQGSPLGDAPARNSRPLVEARDPRQPGTAGITPPGRPLPQRDRTPGWPDRPAPCLGSPASSAP